MEDFQEYACLMKISGPAFRGLVNGFKGRKQFTDFVNRWQGDQARSFLICQRSDGVIAGSIGLFNIVRLSAQNAFVGYSVGMPHLRQGYATEALQLLLRYAFRKLRLHRVEASIQPHNAASRKLVRRAGFTCEGVSRRYVKIGGRWRDHERWALLAEDWRKHAAR